jgi:hypothetical protein
MTIKEYVWTAVDCVIDLAAENGLKYRRLDFNTMGVNNGVESWKSGNNLVGLVGDNQNPQSVFVLLYYAFPRCGKRLKSARENFYNYANARVKEDGVFFSFTLNELEIKAAGSADASEDRIEQIIGKVQKLLALADESKNNSEAEAVAASMMAQKLLAKYNIDIAQVTGAEKDEEIEQIVADMGTGNKWKYTLSEVVARSYCCKHFYYGSEAVVFYGYKSDALIARRVFMYLFGVGKRLAGAYVKRARENGEDTTGVYNSFCIGFVSGINAELSKNCKALALIVPPKVADSFSIYTESFKTTDHSVKFDDGIDSAAFYEGQIEGVRALNAQYLDK